MEPTEDWYCSDAAELLRAPKIGHILFQWEMRDLVVIRRVILEHATQLRSVEHDQVVESFAPNRADEALDVSVLPRRARRSWWPRIPIVRMRWVQAKLMTPSRSRSRWRGAPSQVKASVTWLAIHSALGLVVNLIVINRRRAWRRIIGRRRTEHEAVHDCSHRAALAWMEGDVIRPPLPTY